MQSQIIKRLFSLGELVVRGDAHTHTHTMLVQTPSEKGSWWGFDGNWSVQAFYSHVPRLSRLDVFPEDFGKISLAFPCVFQSRLHGVLEPARARWSNARFPGDAQTH